MAKLDEFKKHLKEGEVYRRADMVLWSNAVDRHIAQLVKEDFLEKQSPGIYYVPKKSVFGKVPPDEESLVRSFLKDEDFLVTSPNAYNSLGVGTTQLYNKRVVYNHKRHGEFKLGGRTFFFHSRHRFPKTLSTEFLLVDLVNNLNSLAEDTDNVLKNVATKAQAMDSKKLKRSVSSYGNLSTKNFFKSLLNSKQVQTHVF
jgi:hypothetical protein